MSKSEIQADVHCDSGDFDPVQVAFSNLVKDYRDPQTGRRGAMALAKVIGMKPHVLANKANLAYPDSEPTVSQLRAAMLAAKNFSPLEALNGDCGLVCIPIEHFNATGDVGLLEQYTKLDAARGDVASAIHAALTDKTLTKPDITRIRESTIGEIAALEGMLARLDACAEPEKNL
jgi:hypothetical protein